MNVIAFFVSLFLIFLSLLTCIRMYLNKRKKFKLYHKILSQVSINDLKDVVIKRISIDGLDTQRKTIVDEVNEITGIFSAIEATKATKATKVISELV